MKMMRIKTFDKKYNIKKLIEPIVKPWLVLYLDRIFFLEFGDCAKYINIDILVDDFLKNDENIMKKCYDSYKFIYKYPEFSDFIFDTQFMISDIPSECVLDFDDLFDDDSILKSMPFLIDFFDEQPFENSNLKFLEEEIELSTSEIYHQIFIFTYASVKQL